MFGNTDVRVVLGTNIFSLHMSVACTKSKQINLNNHFAEQTHILSNSRIHSTIFELIERVQTTTIDVQKNTLLAKGKTHVIPRAQAFYLNGWVKRSLPAKLKCAHSVAINAYNLKVSV